MLFAEYNQQDAKFLYLFISVGRFQSVFLNLCETAAR